MYRCAYQQAAITMVKASLKAQACRATLWLLPCPQGVAGQLTASRCLTEDACWLTVAYADCRQIALSSNHQNELTGVLAVVMTVQGA